MARDPDTVTGAATAAGVDTASSNPQLRNPIRLEITTTRLPSSQFELQADALKTMVGFQQRLLPGHAVLLVRIAYRSPRFDAADPDGGDALANRGDIVMGLDQFMMTDVSEREVEKLNHIYTLGDPVTYTGGRTPRIYSYVGVLVRDRLMGFGGPRWVRAYEDFMRARTAGEAGYECTLHYLDQVRRGVILQYNMSQDANDEARMTFGFTMFVVDDG